MRSIYSAFRPAPTSAVWRLRDDLLHTACFVLFLIAVALHSACQAFAAEGPPRPNIVFIVADDLGGGDCSAIAAQGGSPPDIRTPAIDRLFQQGVSLDQFYANSCVCSPTRAAILTGCYPDRVGVPGVIRDTPDNSWGYLAPQATLLPQSLKGAGYHTAIVGKWHLGYAPPNTPTDRGFDHFQGFLGDMMDDYWSHLRNGHNFMRRQRDAIEPDGHATDLFTKWACDYLRDRADKPEPFFLYLAYNAPHDPIQPPAEWLAKVRKREPQIGEARAKLVALIEHMDDGIGKVLAALDQAGLAGNTLVIFTSDNGGSLAHAADNGPWRSGKQHMYEGGLRVLCAARWPGRRAPGGRRAEIGLTMDLFPTALEAAGLPAPADIDGVSLLPALLDANVKLPPRDLYFVRREGGPAYGGKTIEALRRGDWKLVHDSPFAPLELYNLATDPREEVDLADRQPKIVAELSAALRAHIQRGGQAAWQTPADD